MDIVTVASRQLPNKELVSPELWARLTNRIVKDEGCELTLAERVMDQALGFLRLCAAEPGMSYSPSPMVDIGWHTFILYTREYRNFCESLGGFIDHNPSDELGVDYSTNGISRTLAAMAVRGIHVDEALWNGAVGDCGGQYCHTCVD